MNDYIIKFSELAAITLEENILFLENFNVNYSLRMREAIIKEIDNLVIFPHSHPIYKKTKNCIYRKLTVMKRYNVIYTVEKNIIIIFYIINNKQVYDRFFKSLR